MIDPIHALAFSIQANPGVYAVLLGSGVSRAAGIPTGWDITLDLIRKLAVLQEESCEPDPEGWHRQKFETEPDYSNLLDNLAGTPTERQQLLRAYWEPTEKERKTGDKQPTIAHRSIAAMAADGFTRTIVTTNFDRLMESALRDAGVEPTVLSTPDQMAGALPLIHTKCCVFKVHGDYLDARIRNTRAELDAYPPEFDQFLDRMLDEFGLVVCGWSAEWDGALRSAVLRTKSRRFTTFWATRGEPGEKAQKLISHRAAEVLQIRDADTFFRDVWQHVKSIEEFSKPHPLSAEAAVASLKRYLSDRQYRIQLADLIDAEVERVVALTSTESYSAKGRATPDTASVTARVRGYEAACSTLLAMAAVGGYWAEKEHHAVWQRALKRLYPSGPRSGDQFWLDLQKYPATLLLYALGLGAVEATRLDLLGSLVETAVARENSEDIVAAVSLTPSTMFDSGNQWKMDVLEGMDQHFAPLSNWLHAALRETMRCLIPDDDQYTFVFDKFEVLAALACGRRLPPARDGYWAPPGAFGHRDRADRQRVIEAIRRSLKEDNNSSPFVVSGIFGKTAAECTAELSKLEALAASQRWWKDQTGRR